MNTDRIVTTATRNLTDLIVAYLLAILVGGGTVHVFELAKIILAIKLNIFALPLAHTPALGLPLWTYYVISVMWIAQFVHLSGYTAREVVEELEEAYYAFCGKGVDARGRDG